MHIFIYLLHFRGLYEIYLEVEHVFLIGSTMENGVELYSDELTFFFFNHGFNG